MTQVYKLISIQFDSEDTFTFEVQWNFSHPLFMGHFKGYPIVPAAIIINCIHERLFRYLEANGTMYSIESAKFLKPILPGNEKCSFYVNIIKVNDSYEFKIIVSSAGDEFAKIRMKYNK